VVLVDEELSGEERRCEQNCAKMHQALTHIPNISIAACDEFFLNKLNDLLFMLASLFVLIREEHFKLPFNVMMQLLSGDHV